HRPASPRRRIQARVPRTSSLPTHDRSVHPTWSPPPESSHGAAWSAMPHVFGRKARDPGRPVRLARSVETSGTGRRVQHHGVSDAPIRISVHATLPADTIVIHNLNVVIDRRYRTY